MITFSETQTTMREYRHRMNVMQEVLDERERQDEKWGQQDHPDGTGGTGFVFVATAVRSACERAFTNGSGTWRHILAEEYCEALAESDPVKLREELVQVAAVTVSWIQAVDRRLLRAPDDLQPVGVEG